MALIDILYPSDLEEKKMKDLEKQLMLEVELSSKLKDKSINLEEEKELLRIRRDLDSKMDTKLNLYISADWE